MARHLDRGVGLADGDGSGVRGMRERAVLIGARFDIASGELTTMDADGRFIPPG